MNFIGITKQGAGLEFGEGQSIAASGALLVGGGLLAKTLYDRGLSRREARRRGEELLDKTTEEPLDEQ